MSLPIPVQTDAPPVAATPRNLRAVPEETERRLFAVQQALLAGKPAREIVVSIRDGWGLSRRSAQVYVQRAQRLLAQEAENENRLAYLRTSREQRDVFLAALLRCVSDPAKLDAKTARAVADLGMAATRIIDSRDKAAAIESHIAIGRHVPGVEVNPAEPIPEDLPDAVQDDDVDDHDAEELDELEDDEFDT